MDDGLSNKGVLYAKIQIDDSKIIHLFNLHTQANFYRSDSDGEIANNLVRSRQIVEIKDFVERVLREGFRDGDLCFVLGDFNVDGNYYGFPSFEVLKFFDCNPFGEEFVRCNEYFLMHLIFNRIKGFRFFNCYEECEEFPHTFGEFLVDDEKNKVPKVF